MANHLTPAILQKQLRKLSRRRKTADAAADIQRYFLDRKLLVDSALERYFKPRDPQISPLLHEAICYSALDAGKRFRPILTLAVGELFGAQPVPLLRFACAVELIHCYSLIHDDLPALDNDDIRRGKASCHKRFGEAIALLAGDALLTEAFFIISDPAVARLFGSSLTAQLIREISESAGMRGMISGQSRELELDGRVVTPKLLEELDRLKTGALITTAARVGALIGGSGRKDLDRITRYAQCLGLAFQITDDILDEHETTTDAHKGLINYFSVAGKAKASERVQSLFDQCLKEIEPYGKAAEPLRAIARYVTERKQ